MATPHIKLVYGSTTETCMSSTTRVTTPSLILVDGSTSRYTPLYSGSAGSTVVNGRYQYTLGHLIADGKRAVIGQTDLTSQYPAGYIDLNNINTSTADCKAVITARGGSGGNCIITIQQSHSTGGNNIPGTTYTYSSAGSGTTGFTYTFTPSIRMSSGVLYYMVILTASNSNGYTSSASLTVYPTASTYIANLVPNEGGVSLA